MGAGTGLLAWALFEGVTEPLLVGVLTSAAILVITGLHHTDGLADMADGLMVRGNPRRKIDAMKDRHTGIAGTSAVLLCMVGLVVAVSMLGGGPAVLVGLILAETAAKFSMTVMAIIGKPAVTGTVSGGTGAVFVKAMAEDRRKAVAACAIAVALFLVLGGPVHGLAILAVAICAPLVLSYVASKNFGGVTGDVFGATNDITRIAALVTFVSI